MSDSGSAQYAEFDRPPPTVLPATACMVTAFLAAVAGILCASSLPTWLPWVALIAAAAGALAFFQLSRTRPAPASNLATPAAVTAANPTFATRLRAPLALAVLSLLIFTGALQLERRRQAANFDVAEQLFREALPPFDSVGAVPDPADSWLTERDLPRLRIAHITAEVIDAPPPPAPRQQLENRPRAYLLRTESINAIGGPVSPLHALIRVAVAIDPRLPAPAPATSTPAPALDPTPLYPLPGQRIEAVLRLTELNPGAVAPGQFDPELDWLLAGIHARATLDPRQWRRLPDDGAFNPLFTARRARIFLAERINTHLTGREADTLRALCWGDSSDLTFQDRQSFQQTGTAHLLAISGLHIYVLLFLLFVLTRPLIRSEPRRLLCLAALVWSYAALTGFHEPVLRAVLMFTLWIGARIFQRRFDALNAWALSGLTILCFSPQSAHTVGFQMSYLAVGMLIWWAPSLGDWLIARAGPWLNRFFLPTVVESTCRSLAAGTIGLTATLPLTVYYFGVAPFWAVGANLVLIPLFELLLLLALPATLWFCVSDPGWPAALLQAATHYALAAADGLATICGAPSDAHRPAIAALMLASGLLLATGYAFRRAFGGASSSVLLGPTALRRRFQYPSFFVIVALAAVPLLTLTGAAPPPVADDLLVLSTSHPCVVAMPAADAGTPRGLADFSTVAFAPHAGAHQQADAWDACLPAPPDDPGAIEAALRQPIARWHLINAPDLQDSPRFLTPHVVLACDGPAARANLLAMLTTHPTDPPEPVLLLLYLTSQSDRDPALPAAFARDLPAHVSAVVLLDTPLRLLEPDAQAWLAWSIPARRPVLAADLAPLWRIHPDGRRIVFQQTNAPDRTWNIPRAP